jgi:hypothetical protein
VTNTTLKQIMSSRGVRWLLVPALLLVAGQNGHIDQTPPFIGGGPTPGAPPPLRGEFSDFPNQFVTDIMPYRRESQPHNSRPSALANLDEPKLKKGLKMIWFSTGSDEGLIGVSKETVDMLNRHGFSATFQVSAGAHSSINWRNYLHEVAPKLFQ